MKINKDEIASYLNELYPDAHCELNYDSIFHLLIAVMLSAQTTDNSVNKVTPVLFEKYVTPLDLANANIEDVENIIRSIGLYKNKAKNIIASAKKICDEFNGEVPSDFSSLVSLPGVGRKTANVMLIVAFNTPAIPVDTHIFRVSNRLGLTNAKTETECEEQLTKLYKQNKDLWGKLHHLILLFGRYNCKAIKPNCEGCILSEYCKHYKKKG